ncbi:MAG: helix-turn-helix transcriptional regulator [Novosphingobium sp.]|uniref:helix-turn-helix domain-containing protein n=1 Tax=Novosphingobium sp. TaxID=1874826 RepID=UPI0030185AAE
MGDVTELMERFGGLVARHRKRMGMTQVALSEACGISVDMIVRIEGGGTGVRFPNIQHLADALQVDPAELFTSEVPSGKLARSSLNQLTTRLAALSDAELHLVSQLIDVALKFRR